MSEIDYDALPVGELLTNKAWKARQVGYSKLKRIAEKDIKDFQVVDLINDVDALKNIAADSNMVSQEAGIDLLLYLLKSSDPKIMTKSRESVIPPLVEKGLMSSKANTKTNSAELILHYVEVDSPIDIIELIIPSLSAKSPKLIIAAIKVLNEIYSEFGCIAVNPKIIIDHIPKMFAHSDKNVRAEATKLCVVIRSYVGQSLDTVIFPKLKPIQQKDLTAIFEKIEPGVTPQRLLLVEKLRIEASRQKSLQDTGSGCDGGDSRNPDGDIEMEDRDTSEQDRKPIFDPHEFEDPVDVLSKLPTDLSDRLNDPVWKERVEALESITPFFKVPKFQNDDYSYFVSMMVGCLRDVNLQVLTLSCGILANMSRGLKSNFSKYVSTLINPLLERTKEKKKPVLDALHEVLDLCFKYGSFNEIVEPVVEHMKHISPPVKVETMSYLVRCLKELTSRPSNSDVEIIMLQAIKLLQDSQLPVRNGASEVLSTLMKIIGTEASKKYMDKIDKRHIKKIEQLCKNAVVRAGNTNLATNNDTTETSKSTNVPHNSVSKKSVINGNFVQNAPSLPPSTSYSVSIPSKRAATSPIRDNVPNSKNTLTSRSLKASSINNYGISSHQIEENESLKAEKLEWINMKKEMQAEIDELRKNNDELLRNVVSLNDKIDSQHSKYTVMSMSLKSKDTQIFRLRSDIENMTARNSQQQQKLRMLENQLEMTKKAHSNAFVSSNNDMPSNVDVSTDESSEINRRISILSIDSKTGEPRDTTEKPKVLETQSSTLYNIDDKDDGWIRATAITNDLKAKIQRMKARTRTLGSADE